ncbi:hypothetical protein NliqN6_1820 [Naganishia liquefaciens]|uniref:tRNA-intron lyase n=1 Tax=Naganishia liquefaciens TaxID=104408 RepID=A0A8H3YDP0_9TREE|nr:hypothetical protein NliqN6_1820 [Naganishia liquefaciens]
MSAAPARGGPSSRGNRGGKASSYARTRANNLKYGTPLPIVLPASPLHPAYVEPPVPEFILARRRAQAAERGETGPVEGEPSPRSSLSFLVQLLSKLSSSKPSREAIIPRCKGTYDPLTRSVFVTSPEDRDILFDRGFFGKGNLSRSEASWKTRRVKLLQEMAGLAAAGGNRDGMKMTAEEVTAARRRERKQFKIDRAQAILNASLAAEAILRSSVQPAGDIAAEPQAESSELTRVDSTLSQTTTTTTSAMAPNAVGTQSDIAIPNLTDYAHVLPEGVTRLTPQTFLQRPTRPDAKPKGKKPPPPAQSVASAGASNEQQSAGDGPAQSAPQATLATVAIPSAEELVDPETVEDLEHLQLNLEEAFFLSWAVGCLDVVDPQSNEIMTPHELFQHILSLSQPFKPPPPASSYMAALQLRRPDNPFLISYIAYHHYRSLGWVVKTGIKFCVDWLLYKKGMVFSHAEFALLVIPHHLDPEDASVCPFALNNEQPMSWQWLNTVNRVNTQVKKTLILCYVTIPSASSITEEDWSRPERIMSRYSVREVTIRRFVPARMRD